MLVSEALKMRKSIRAFSSTLVDRETLVKILELAARAPSGGNIQPWKVHVLTGDALNNLSEKALLSFRDNYRGQKFEHAVYPDDLPDPYRTRRRVIGAQMYELLKVDKDDKVGKLEHLSRNFRFFNAPVGLLFSIDKLMEPVQWTDLGFYLQSICLLATEYGLGTCPQGIWAMVPGVVRDCIDLGCDEVVICGMALGYEEPGAPVNQLQSERAQLEEFCFFYADI